MRASNLGWSWFDVGPRDARDDAAQFASDPDLTNAYARTFCSDSGRRVLGHLRSITSGRVLGPDSSDAALRYVEGQRQLVQYISSLVERGRSETANGHSARVTSIQGNMEKKHG